MAIVTDTTTDANGNVIIDVSSSADDSITLATAGNYSDKNIIFNLAVQKGAADPILQEKTVTYTENGTATITPDEGYDGLSSVDVTVDVASGGGGTEPATLTITSQDYTGNKYATFIFVNPEGHIEKLSHYSSSEPFTFPITIKTVLGGFVVFVPSGFSGIPCYRNPIGCEAIQHTGVFYILVTSPQGSIEIHDND